MFFSWQIDTFFNGERVIKRGFRSEQAAQDHVKSFKEQERLKEIGVVQLIKFPKVKDLFERHGKTLKNKKTQTTFDRVTKAFLSIVPSQNLTLDELKRKYFKDFADKRIKEGIKAESANREITEISSAVHSAGDYFENLKSRSVPEHLIYRPEFKQTERIQVWTRGERESPIKYLLREKELKERSRAYRARRFDLIFRVPDFSSARRAFRAQKSNFNRESRRLVADLFKTKKKGVSLSFFETLTDPHLWVLSEAETLYLDGEYFFSEKGKNP